MHKYHFGPVSSFSFIACKDPGPRVKDKMVERGQKHCFLNFPHLVRQEMYLPLEHSNDEGFSRMNRWIIVQSETCV